MLQRLHPRQTMPTISLYTDDILLFCHPSTGDINAVKSILKIFGQASGLLVNYSKSSAALLHCDVEEAELVATGLGCPVVALPMTYLGIPLMVRRPATAQLQPLVAKVADKLPTWITRLMHKAGRLALVKAVVCAVLIHQLLVLAPSKKTLKLIQKIQRSFFWEGRAQAKGGNCHVNFGSRFAGQPLMEVAECKTSSVQASLCAYGGSGSVKRTPAEHGMAWTCSSLQPSAASSSPLQA